HRRRQGELAHAPAAMAEEPSIRQCPLHVTRKLDLARIEPLCENDTRALFFRAHGLDLDVAREGTPAPFVDHPRRGADLCVAERGNLLLHEIDEASLALQEAEERERRARPATVGRTRWTIRQHLGPV